MKEIFLNELKTIQLDVLDVVASFCEKENISYFLAYGTLIGAIRHNGYIPWDDDIDIIMPRPDYEKFLNSFNGFHPHIRSIDIRSNTNYCLPFAKAYDIRTIVDESMYKEKDIFGVFIDIFPLDGFGNMSQVKKIRFYNRLLNTKSAVLNNQRKILKNILMGMGKIVLLPFTKYSIIKRMQETAQICSYDESEFVDSMFSPYSLKEICHKSVFSVFIYKEFEGKQYRIPQEYDSYLKLIYGDYMKLPPIEKRISHHSSRAWWK